MNCAKARVGRQLYRIEYQWRFINLFDDRRLYHFRFGHRWENIGTECYNEMDLFQQSQRDVICVIFQEDNNRGAVT